tara:strand:- start:452 stop:829 length:378 start_codon:yes stop_codon:yes gene_type:complete
MSIKNIAPKFPIEVGLGEGIVPIREDNIVEVVKFQLKNLILTRPGEKISDADFGIGLSNFLFSQHTARVPAIKSRILQQISRYCNYFDFLEVKVAISNKSDLQITVNIRFVITEFKVKDEIEVTV